MRKPLAAVAGVAAMLVPAGPAFALHCKVADKPPGAGVADPDEVKVTSSGHVVFPGAFINPAAFTGDPNAPNEDVFIRGGGEIPEFLEEFFEPVNGAGTLPSQPHENGSPDHGVVEIAEPGG